MASKRDVIGYVNPNFGSFGKPKPIVEFTNKKPNKLPLGKSIITDNSKKLELRGNKNSVGQNQALPEMQAQGNSVKNNQKRVSQEFSTSRPKTTSTTTTTTSSTSTPERSTSTSTSQTTSMPKRYNNNNNRDRNPSQDGGNNARSNNRPQYAGGGRNSSSNYTPTSVVGISMTPGPFQGPNSDRGIFIPESVSTPIDYQSEQPCILHKNLDEQAIILSDNTSGETLNKTEFNVASFGKRILDIKAGVDQKSVYYRVLYDIFNKMQTDLWKNARSNLYANWTWTNFLNYLYLVVYCFELFLSIDSEMSYRPDPAFGVNKGFLDRRNYILTQSLLVKRADLRQALIGMWIPPQLAQLMRWFYQSYKHSDTPNSCCYRFVASNLQITNDFTALGTEIDTLINPSTGTLRTTTNGAITALLATVYPQGIVSDIPGAYNDAIFDPHHYEMYINCPVKFIDPNNKVNNVASFYPCPTTNTMDVPYYMVDEPTSSNGFAMLMQGLYIGNGTKFNVDTTGEATNSSIIKHMTAAPSTGAYNTADCSKFFYDNAGLFQPRIYDAWHNYQHSDAHFPIIVTTNTNGISRLPRGFQRMYYNNYQASEINMKKFVNSLFGLIT